MASITGCLICCCSGNSVATAVSHPQTGTYQDSVASVPAMENTNSSPPLESEGKILDPRTGVETQNMVHVSGFPLSLQFDKPQVQFVHAAAPHHLPQNQSGMVPVTPYCLMNSPVPQQQMYYQTNQPHPIYVVPVGYPYRFPMQSSLVNPANVSSTHPPPHPNPSLNPAQMAYKVAAASPAPELGSQVYRMIPTASPLVNAPHNENHQQAEGLPQMNLQAQSMGTANYTNELDDDPARSQIYKSQPPPPTLPSRYRTMTKATPILLSEALAQLHTENIKQQP